MLNGLSPWVRHRYTTSRRSILMSETPKPDLSSTGVRPATSDTILLGRITGAHGIQGDVLVHSFAAEPADIAAYGPLSDKSGARQFRLRVLRMTPKGAVIARIAGVADRNAAEALKGVELYVARKKLPQPDDGEFYHADLIGLAAVAPEGSALGEIIAVHNFGAGDLIEIRMAGTNATELVPFNDRYVPTVDLATRRAVVVMPVSAPEGGDEGESV